MKTFEWVLLVFALLLVINVGGKEPAVILLIASTLCLCSSLKMLFELITKTKYQ